MGAPCLGVLRWYPTSSRSPTLVAVILAESPEAEAEPDALASPPALALPEASPEGALLAEPLELALELELPLADELAPELEEPLEHAARATSAAGAPNAKRVRRVMGDCVISIFPSGLLVIISILPHIGADFLFM